MIEMNSLADKIFALLKGNGLKIKIFDADGAETTNPADGRRFFVNNPNIMVTIDEESNSVQFSKGNSVSDDVEPIQKNIRKIADEFLMNSDIKIFGKTIQPRDYAYQAKMNKGESMNENADIKPINHQLVGQVMNMIRVFGGKAAEHEIANNLGVMDISELRPVLNRLVSDGKLKVENDKHGQPVYSKSMDEAVFEGMPGPLSGSDYMPGPRVKFDNTNCTTCHGRKFLYKTPDGKLHPDNKVGAKRVVCNQCNGTGDKLSESFSKMFGSLKTSQQTLENVRILVKHKKPVDESVRGARSRQISSIFLECNGERFRFPHNYLPGARAMAQHLAHGGTMSDKVGLYISESTSNLLKLQSFNRYVTTNKLINEDSSSIVETVKENIETLRAELKKLTGTKTYETVKARIETFEKEQLSEDDTTQLKDLFTIRRFDEKFEEVLPIVKQLVLEKDTYYKRIEEAASSTVLLKKEALSTTPMFEFSSPYAKIGFKLNELALRITENDELAGFVNKVGTKLCKEGAVNDFEFEIIKQIFENSVIESDEQTVRSEIKEATDLSAYFDRFDNNFL